MRQGAGSGAHAGGLAPDTMNNTIISMTQTERLAAVPHTFGASLPGARESGVAWPLVLLR